MSADNYNEVFRSQRIFKDLIDAFSHPFKVCNIDSGSAVKELCFVLLDNEVSFYVDEETALSSEIKEMTYAKAKDIELADFIIVTNPQNFDAFDKIKQGTLANPNEGATVIVSVPQIEGDEKITAEGPGIDGSLSCGIHKSIIDFLDKANREDIEYPKGFEIVFVTQDADIIAVPRRVKVRRDI